MTPKQINEYDFEQQLSKLGRRNLPDYARVELNLRKEDILKPLAKANKLGQGISVINVDKINVQKEIDKCILLCPNCHRWLHYKEG